MKILHVIPSFARNRGGPSEVVQHLLPALMAKGVSVELATTDIGVAAGDAPPECPHHIFKGYPPSSLTYSPAFAAWMRRYISQFDIVHAHGFYSHTTTIAVVEALRASKPVVLQPHGVLDAYHRKDSRAKKRAYELLAIRGRYQHLARLVVSSERELVGAAEWGFQRQIACKVPLGVDPDILSAAPRETQGHQGKILFLGRVSQKKRVDLLVDAFLQLRSRGHNVSLSIAGPWEPPMQELQRRVEALSQHHPIYALGLVERSERLQLMREHDVFAYVSDDESFGISVAEAMAAGCAVVASQEVGLAEEAARAGALLTVDQTTEDVARGLAKAASSFGARLSEAGVIYARKHFTWSQAADLLAAEYAGLC